MSQKVSPKITALTFGVLVVSFLLAFYVVAWQEPTEAPPGGNVATPLNVGPEGQSKQGWLHTLKSLFAGDTPSTAEQQTTGILRTTGGAILNTGGAVNGLIIDKGNLCLGTDCRSIWPIGNIGDITAVNAGSGLTGGGSSGGVTLNLGTSQKRTIETPWGSGIHVSKDSSHGVSSDWATCPSGEYVCGVKFDTYPMGAAQAGPFITLMVQCCGK